MRVTKQPDIDRFYNALIHKDPSYLGSYFVGVKSTGIFCISTCKARKPLKKNVEFFTELKETLSHGYRPCKVCKPTEKLNSPPPFVTEALKLLKDSPKEKVKDYHLRNVNIAPERLRRWFNVHYGMTFHNYQRMVRINMAFQELKAGKNVTDSAYNAGYESLSGFGYTFKKLIGKAPKNIRDKTRVLIQRIESPLGPMFVAATQKGICLLEFTDRRMLETEFRDLQKLLNAVILVGENPHILQLKKGIVQLFFWTTQEIHG